jgi:hypothetical protein
VYITRIKVKVKVKLPYNRPRRPRGGEEVQLYSSFNLGAIWRWVVNTTPRPLYPGKDMVPIG